MPRNKEPDIKILKSLEEKLKDKLPVIKFNCSPESNYRLIMPWKGNDYFLFDFSSEVPDGIRCAFVVDLDKKNSQARRIFQNTMLAAIDEVRDTIKTSIENRVRNSTLYSQGLKAWTKISRHRRMGIYTFYRYPDRDWTNIEEMAKVLAPCIYEYVERMNPLIQYYWPKKNSGKNIP
jgi:hypothetical protein